MAGSSHTLTMDEVYEMLKEKRITLLDSRPAEEYEAGHIEGAVSVPMEQLDLYLQKLSKDKTIVVGTVPAGYKWSSLAAAIRRWKRLHS